MKHTPGPWKWWTSCSWRRLMGDVHNRERHVLQPTNHPIDHHPDIIVTDADMALIEAAPELLEALKGLVGAHLVTPGSRGIMVDIPHFLEKANAAIAKAEGKK